MKITLTLTIERTPKPATQAVHSPPAAPTSKLPEPTPDFRRGQYA